MDGLDMRLQVDRQQAVKNPSEFTDDAPLLYSRLWSMRGRACVDLGSSRRDWRSACSVQQPPMHRPIALPSWNDGPAKKAILDFVARTTTAGAPGFVPVPERIAVFDNDGTLWAEQPVYFQFAVALDRLKALAPQHPEWRDARALQVRAGGRHGGAGCHGREGPARDRGRDPCRHDDRGVFTRRSSSGSRRPSIRAPFEKK